MRIFLPSATLFFLFCNITIAQTNISDDSTTQKIEDQTLRGLDHATIFPSINVKAADSEEKTPPSVSIKITDLTSSPELLSGLMNSAIESKDIKILALLLPQYRKLSANERNPFVYHYAEALVAESENKFGKAIEEYQKILATEQAQDPDIKNAIDYQIARQLFNNHAIKEARELFIKVKNHENTFPIVQDAVDQYLTAIQKIQKPQFGIGFNYLNNDNINEAPSKNSGLKGWKTDDPENGRGLLYTLSLTKDFNFIGNHNIHASTYVYGEYYWNSRDYNDIISRTYLGYRYQDVRHTFTLSPFYERRWFSNRSYSQTVGGRLSYDYLISPKLKSYNALEYGYIKHDDRKHLDGQQHNASTTLVFAPNATQFFIGGLQWYKEKKRYKSDSYTRIGGRLGWGQQWPKNISTNIQLNYADRRFQGPDILKITKNIEEYQATFTVWHRKISLFDIIPKLSFNWKKQHSNHPFYRYNRSQIYLDFSKDF